MIKLIKKLINRFKRIIERRDNVDFDVIEKITEACELLDELDDYFSKIPKMQSDNDLAISDLYHYIENNPITTKGSYRMIKELKEHLLTRRNLKVDLDILRTYDNNKAKLENSGNRQFLLSEVNKTKNKLNAPYNYRVYENEDELKERIEH